MIRYIGNIPASFRSPLADRSVTKTGANLAQVQSEAFAEFGDSEVLEASLSVLNCSGLSNDINDYGLNLSEQNSTWIAWHDHHGALGMPAGMPYVESRTVPSYLNSVNFPDQQTVIYDRFSDFTGYVQITSGLHYYISGFGGFYLASVTNSYNYSANQNFISVSIPAFPSGYLQDNKFVMPETNADVGTLFINTSYNESTGNYTVQVGSSWGGSGTLQQRVRAYYQNLSGTITDATPGGVSTEPYQPGGFSSFGIGGGGVYNMSSDVIQFPSLPSLSAVQTGLINLYADSSINGMLGLASYLWSSAFDLDTFKKLFSDPMDLIIGASIMPCAPSVAASTIVFGNIDTNISMPKVTNQYTIVDCGSAVVPEFWGAYLDYSPFTKISVYLPYIGTRQLNTDEIMNKTLQIRYYVDVLTGACTAMLAANGNVLYSWGGSCATQIPITSSNWASVISSLVQVAGSAIGGFTMGGVAGAAITGGTALASNALTGGMKPDFQRGGSVTGSSGYMGVQNPYLILELPRQSVPRSYNAFSGYPSNVSIILGQCSGYTKVEEIHIENIGCTNEEQTEIENLLKGGVLM